MLGNDKFIQYLYNAEKFVDLNIYQYGWEACKPLHSFGPYIRNHLLFHYVISGEGEYTVHIDTETKRTFRVKAGEGFLIFPEYVTIYNADSQNPWEYTWIEFDGITGFDTVEKSGLSVNNPIFRSTSREANFALKMAFKELVENGDSTPLHVASIAFKILDEILKNSDKKVEINENRQIKFYMNDAVTFIEQYFHQNITVNDLAHHVNLSRSYFSSLFREHTGKSPQEYIMTHRMKKASQLLLNTNIPIKEISAAVGYPNQLHFSKVFKTFYEESPRQWRKNYQLPPSNNTSIAAAPTGNKD